MVSLPSPAIQHKAHVGLHTRRVDGVVAVAGTDNQPIAGIGTTMPIAAASPATLIELPELEIWILGRCRRAVDDTLSAWASPLAAAGVALKSTFTCLMPVLARSPIVTLSARPAPRC